MPRQRKRSTGGCGCPKEGKLTVPRVREGFLEEVVTELGTSKSQPEEWVGLPVEGWLSRGREARCFSFLRAGKQSSHPRPESVSGPLFS